MGSVTQNLVADYNAARRLKYPDVGYLLFQDVKGDGHSKPALYVICNAAGGVSYSSMNGRNARQRCKKLRAAVVLAKTEG